MGSITELYIANGYLIVILLASAIVVVITFKFSKKSTATTSEVVKAERMLLYHMTFVTFWIILGVIAEIVDFYLWEIKQEPKWLRITLGNIFDFCLFVSNAGSLLFLFCLSNAIRKEFYKTFNFLRKFKPKTTLISAIVPTVS